MNTINEENFKKYFDVHYSETKNLVSAFKKIEDQVKFTVGDKKYESITSNYIPLFIYEAVNTRLPIEEFRDFIQYFYQNEHFGKKEIFYRFFNDSSNVYLFKYVENNRNSDSIWDDIKFVFLDTDEKKKHIFNKK